MDVWNAGASHVTRCLPKSMGADIRSRARCRSPTMADPAAQRRRIVVLISGSGPSFFLSSYAFSPFLSPDDHYSHRHLLFLSLKVRICKLSSTHRTRPHCPTRTSFSFSPIAKPPTVSRARKAPTRPSRRATLLCTPTSKLRRTALEPRTTRRSRALCSTPARTSSC